MASELSGPVRVRAYRPADAAALVEAVHASLPELSRWLPWAHEDYSVDDALPWIEAAQRRLEAGEAWDLAVVDAEDRLLGGVGINQLSPGHRMANLGYWVRSDQAGRGVASSAGRQLASFGFEILGLARLEILVQVGNDASCRVAEKVGARREGVLRNRMRVRDRQVDCVLHGLIPEDLGGETP